MQTAYVTHAVQGRARLKIPAERGNGLFFARLQDGLGHCPDVESIQVNHRAGSALISLAGNGSLVSVGHYARQHHLFALANEPLPLKTLGQLVSEQVAEVNGLIGTGSRGHVDLQTVFFFVFLLLGAKQLWRGQIMQPAIPLLWRALEILKGINKNMDL